jgi:hypothetical protein
LQLSQALLTGAVELFPTALISGPHDAALHVVSLSTVAFDRRAASDVLSPHVSRSLSISSHLACAEVVLLVFVSQLR